MSRERVYLLDVIRGVAVIGMILHHALFAVETVSELFGDPIRFAVLETTAFWVIQEVFVGAFLVVSGICTAFSRNVLRRGLIISAAAVLISLVTGVLLPALGIEGLQIWFGILHLFGLSMLLYGLFTALPRWTAALTAAVLFVLYLSMTATLGSGWSNALLSTMAGLPTRGFFSADYYPLFPYFLLFLAGTFLGPAVRDHRLPTWFYTLRLRPVEWVGRHSLWVYLVHQPLIFGVCALIFYLL